jgi:hypothetical protein
VLEFIQTPEEVLICESANLFRKHVAPTTARDVYRVQVVTEWPEEHGWMIAASRWIAIERTARVLAAP